MGGSPVSPFPIEKWVVEVQTLAVNMCEVVREPFSDQIPPILGVARTPKGARHLYLYSSALKFELVSKFWSDVAGCQYRYVFTHVRTCEHQYARAANKKRRFGCRPSVRAEQPIRGCSALVAHGPGQAAAFCPQRLAGRIAACGKTLPCLPPGSQYAW